MVFFNCNACGEALKKNQVEKHTFRCRQCHVVSCVDCGKDFRGNDYQTHTKCMTEDEKYCGKGYVPKVNKGEAKQEQWIENVQAAIAKSSSKPNLKKLLERLTDYPNIPRKKAKFENFLKNSLRVSTPHLISEVWQVLMEAAPVQSNGNKPEPSTNGSKDAAEPQAPEQPAESSPPETTDEQEGPKHKLSKRERKEERQKNNKKEKKDKVEAEPVETQKGKKRKHEETENGDVPSEELEVKSKKKKKKKDKTDVDEETTEPVENGSNAENCNGTEAEPKFDLKATIKAILQKKEEISLKRLKKKVLAEFEAQSPTNYNEEHLKEKFDKMFDKNGSSKKFTIYKDKVMLKSVYKSKYS